MLIKLIRCQVPDERRAAFDAGQRAWSALAGEPGFVAQLGGWTADGALVLGLWRDADAYRSFTVDGAHDRIFADGGQAGSYSASTVTVLEAVLEMPGAARALAAAVTGAALLRTALCDVRPARVAHFMDVQATVWQPGMAAAPGMLGGVVGQGVEAPTTILVATLWRAPADHARYANERLPGLRAGARPEQDVVRLAGGATALEPAWTVIGVHA